MALYLYSDIQQFFAEQPYEQAEIAKNSRESIYMSLHICSLSFSIMHGIKGDTSNVQGHQNLQETGIFMMLDEVILLLA